MLLGACVIAGLALGIAPASASAATRYASPTGTDSAGCPQTSPCDLSDALAGDGMANFPSSGDEIVVEPGTYTVSTLLQVNVNNLDVHGVAGEPRPVIDVSGNGTELDMSSSSLSYVDIERTSFGGETINDDGTLIDHVLIRGDASGGILCQCYDGTLTDSEVVDTGSGGAAVGINSNGGQGTENYYNDTFVATQSGGFAIELDLIGSPTNPTWTFNAQNVIAFNAAAGGDIVVYSSATSGQAQTATVTLSHSDYQNVSVHPSGSGTNTLNVSAAGSPTNITTSPAFVNAGGGDFHELASSATVGTGVTDPTHDGSLDFDGLLRTLSGLTDMGAFEYQTLGATAGASASSVQVGTPVTFTGAATGPNAGATALTYSWTFDDGATASGQVVSHTFNTPGTHTATLTVGLVDGASLSATAAASLGVTAPPTPTPTPQAGIASAGTATVKGKTATVPITCTGATTCDLTLTLTESETLKGGKVVSVSKVKTKHRSVVVGSASAQVQAGQTGRVTISLNGIGKSLLAKHHTIHPKLSITQGATTVATTPLTFHSKKHKKH